MIDISPYQYRLEMLKEWMANKIDGTLPFTFNKSNDFWIDISCVPEIAWQDAIRIYEQTGVLFYSKKPDHGGMRPVEFHEYLEMIKIKTK